MGFGPTRTPTKSPSRSIVKSLNLAIEGEIPPIPEPGLGCCYTWCEIRPVVDHSPGECSTGLDCNDVVVTGSTSQTHSIVSLASIPSYKNFPYNMRQRDGRNYNYPWNCEPEDWTNFSVATTDGDHGWRIVPFLRGNVIPEMDSNECGVLGQIFLPEEVAIIRFSSAEWTILGFNTPTQIEIGFNRISIEAKIRIEDNGPNDGEYRVAQSSGDLTYVTVEEPVPEPGTSGGKLVLVTSLYRLMVFYTAVSDPADNLWEAFLDTTTGTFSINDSQINIINAAPYNGIQDVVYVSDTRVELGVLFKGRPVSGGTWVSNATVLIVPSGASDTGGRLRISGSGLYDGDYDQWGTTGSNPDLVLFNTFFQGNASGAFVYSGLLLNLINGPPFTFYEGTVVVSGTGLYDGTYPDAIVFIDAPGTGFCVISQPFFEGTATGILTIPELSETADITNIEEDVPGGNFTSAEPQRSGDVAAITPEVMRISCEQVGQWAIGQDAVLISDDWKTDDGPYGFNGREIKLEGLGFLDIEGTYTVDDAGACGIRPG